MQRAPTGVLLVNTGSPDAPDTASVRRYLRQFLSDPRVIDIPAWQRWLLVNLIIAPFRAPKSAHAYQSIWTPQGSPLVQHARALALALAEALGPQLGPDIQVVAGMCYGQPSLESAIHALRNCARIVIVPLFPQYAGATIGSVLEVSYKSFAKSLNVPAITVVPPWYGAPGFIQSVAAVAQPVLKEFEPDVLLYSFHGLPESQVIQAGAAEGRQCQPAEPNPACCLQPSAFCYRAHCATTKSLLEPILGPGQLVFQSRLGRARWLEPSLDATLEALGKAGTRKVAVIAPSFVADCLETLEEIAVRGAEQFKAAGGGELRMIPAVNTSPLWVEALAGLIKGCL